MTYKTTYFLVLWAPVVISTLAFSWALWKLDKTNRTWYQSLCNFWFVVSIIFIILGGVFSSLFGEITRSLFDTDKPRCVKLIQEYPIQSHWSWKRDYIVPGEEASHRCIKRVVHSHTHDSHAHLKEGEYFYLDKIYIRNFEARKDTFKTIRLYALQYDPWWGFEFPSGHEDCWLSMGEDDYLLGGMCKDKVELKP